jgi:hypothetical protein
VFDFLKNGYVFSGADVALQGRSNSSRGWQPTEGCGESVLDPERVSQSRKSDSRLGDPVRV